MKLQLLENGLDSLDSGIDFYDQYLELSNKYTDKYRLLKLAVISIHSAVEILGKYLLSQVNELLIYKNLSDPVLLNRMAKGEEINHDIPLHHYLIAADIDVMTISYKECINRIKHILGLNEGIYEDLKQLGNIRNKITHFGLEREIDFHGIFGTLNRTLEFIMDEYYPRLKKNDENPMDYLYDKILDVIEQGVDEERDIWNTFFANEFEQLNKLLRDVCSDPSITTLLRKHELELLVIPENYSESMYFSIDIFNPKSENCDPKVRIIPNSIPRLDTTFFAGESIDGPIYALIDHSEEKKNFYIYKTPKELDDYERQYKKFWHDDKKSCYPDSLNHNSFRGVLEKIIKELINGS